MPILVALCTIPQNPMVGILMADFMNVNVTRWNEMTRGLVRNNPGRLRLMDLENMLRSPEMENISKPSKGDAGSMTYSDAVKGSGAGIEGDQLSGLEQFDWRR